MKKKFKILYFSNFSIQKKRIRFTVDIFCIIFECVSAKKQLYHITKKCYTVHSEFKFNNKKFKKIISINTEFQNEIKFIIINNWFEQALTINIFWQIFWLLNDCASVQIWNNNFFLNYENESNVLIETTSLKKSFDKNIVRLQLMLKNESNETILNLIRILYILECFVNLINQIKFNDFEIHYNDEIWKLYVKHFRHIVNYVSKRKNNYVIKIMSCFNIIIHFFFVEKIYIKFHSNTFITFGLKKFQLFDTQNWIIWMCSISNNISKIFISNMTMIEFSKRFMKHVN